MNERTLLREAAAVCRRVLEDKLTGVYVHGSLALGCFRWEVSDIDLLIVVSQPLPLWRKTALMEALMRLEAAGPPKGLEMSVLLKSACAQPSHPMPFELHYSAAHRERFRADLAGACRQMHGVDDDLAAHITVLRHAGFALCGEAVRRVFAPIPWEWYLRSVLRDVQDADSARQPVSCVLNLCRTLAAAQEGRVLSKAQGGQWALSQLPEPLACVARQALLAYCRGAPPPGEAELNAFVQPVRQHIQALCIRQCEKH